MFYNYIMENYESNTLNFTDSLKSVLNELEEIVQENQQIVEEVQNYKKEMEMLVSNSDNEFLNLTSKEIDDKLDNILNEVIAGENDVREETKKINNDEQEKIKILYSLTSGLNDTITNVMNIIPKDIINSNTIDEPYTLEINKGNEESDTSTINPDDLDTESGSDLDSDLEEPDVSTNTSNVSTNTSNVSTDTSNVFNTFNINNLMSGMSGVYGLVEYT